MVFLIVRERKCLCCDYEGTITLSSYDSDRDYLTWACPSCFNVFVELEDFLV